MPPKYFDLNVPLKTPLFVVNYFFVAIARFLGGTFCSNLVVRGTKTFYATGDVALEELRLAIKENVLFSRCDLDSLADSPDVWLLCDCSD